MHFHRAELGVEYVWRERERERASDQESTSVEREWERQKERKEHIVNDCTKFEQRRDTSECMKMFACRAHIHAVIISKGNATS